MDELRLLFFILITGRKSEMGSAVKKELPARRGLSCCQGTETSSQKEQSNTGRGQGRGACAWQHLGHSLGPHPAPQALPPPFRGHPKVGSTLCPADLGLQAPLLPGRTALAWPWGQRCGGATLLEMGWRLCCFNLLPPFPCCTGGRRSNSWLLEGTGAWDIPIPARVLSELQR